MEQSGMITCKNCSNTFRGNYCNNCRQPAETHRITWHEIGHNLVHALFHTDKGLLFTIKELLIRPGYSIKEYLTGKRAFHFNPLLFLILTGTLASLIFSFLHLKPPNTEVVLEKIEEYNALIGHKYFIIVGLFFIMLLTVTDFLFYFEKKYVLPELIISNAFQSGQILVFTIAMVPFLILQNYFLESGDPFFDIRNMLKIALLCYLFFTRYQFYEAKGSPVLISKIAIQLALVYIVYNFAVTKLVVHWIIGS